MIRDLHAIRSALVSRDEAAGQGLPRYFTGDPCTQGHSAERYTRSARCVECERTHRNRSREKEKATDPVKWSAKRAAQKQRWRLRDPEKTKQIERKHRLQKKLNRAALEIILDNGKRVSAETRNRYAFDLIVSQAGRCGLCSTYLAGTFEVDHIIPLAVGGANTKRNLQLLCRPCNRKKGGADPLAFSRKLGLLI